MRSFSWLVVSLTFVLACSKKAEPPPATTGSAAGSAMQQGSGSADVGSAAAGSGSAMAGSAAGSDTTAMGSGAAAGSGAGSNVTDQPMSHRAGNCPSTVLGSTTTAKLAGKTVVVTITSNDKDAIAAIQKRTDELLKEKSAPRQTTGAMHDQKGGHGGGIGICPVYVPEGATATAKPDKKGVVVTITPADKADDLKKDVDGRIAKATAWVKENIKPGDQTNQGAVGGGKGEHGSNHSGMGDGKGKERGPGSGGGTGGGGGKGTGGGGGKGTGSGK